MKRRIAILLCIILILFCSGCGAKEENVIGAGASAFGGSLQPQLENSTAEEMTRARAYILAGYLADVRNESFTIPSEIQESIDAADPSLNDVFEKFEGQWIFDEDRAACVGIERQKPVRMVLKEVIGLFG